MSTKLNLFADGSWLFKACRPGGYLALRTENPEMRFKLDFNKFVLCIRNHISNIANDEIIYSKKYIASSIFDTVNTSVPIDEWPIRFSGITKEMIENFIKNITARTRFISNAEKYGGFEYDSNNEILNPRILKQWSEEKYREKLVDTKVAIALMQCIGEHKNNEYYAVVTGDKDLLPALQAKYPDYTKNVLLITTSPDSVAGISSHELVDFVDDKFRLTPFLLDEHIDSFLHIDGD